MSSLRSIAVAALAAFSLVAFAARAAENQKDGALAKQIVGAWTLTSLVLDQDGKKSELAYSAHVLDQSALARAWRSACLL